MSILIAWKRMYTFFNGDASIACTNDSSDPFSLFGGMYLIIDPDDLLPLNMFTREFSVSSQKYEKETVE